MIQIDVLEYLISSGPGRTQIELAKALKGETAVQQVVNQDLALLVSRGKVSVRGQGGSAIPFRYYPA